jgi:PKHD-type hydroxylase
MSRLSFNPTAYGLTTYSFAWQDHLFPPEQLNKIIEWCETRELVDAKVISNAANVTDHSTRQNKVAFHSASHENQWLFEQLARAGEFMNQNYFQFDLIGFDHFQYTVYDQQGSKYDWHADLITGDERPADMPLTRKLSCSLILSDPDEYTGGEFEINTGAKSTIKLVQEKGRILAFPSYTLHRVTPIITGVRKSLVFWINGYKFK